MRQRRIDGARLKRLYARDRRCRALFHHLGQLEGTQNKSTTLEELLAGLLAGQKMAIPRRDLVSLLQSLARAGAGRFKIGRRGKPSRFEWAAPVNRIANSVIGERPPGAVLAVPGSRPTAAASADAQLIHSYHLRRGLIVSIPLPIDLTDREAGRLADFIRTPSVRAGSRRVVNLRDSPQRSHRSPPGLRP